MYKNFFNVTKLLIRREFTKLQKLYLGKIPIDF